jgi:hypothetical protein
MEATKVFATLFDEIHPIHSESEIELEYRPADKIGEGSEVEVFMCVSAAFFFGLRRTHFSK